MKRFTMAIALTGILSVSAMAGDIPWDFTPPPPPPPPPPGASLTASSTSPGDIPCDIEGAIPCDGLAQQAEDVLLGGFLAVMGWLT